LCRRIKNVLVCFISLPRPPPAAARIAPHPPGPPQVLVEVAFNGVVFEGHNSVIFARFAPAPALPAVRIGPSLASVEFVFPNATDRAAFRTSAAAVAACGADATQRCGILWSRPLRFAAPSPPPRPVVRSLACDVLCCTASREIGAPPAP
jgi:hypothetical protein